MKRSILALTAATAAVLPVLAAAPAQADTKTIKPPVGSCSEHWGSPTLASGAYRIARDGKIEYILNGMRGQKDVEVDVFRTTRVGDRLAVNWALGEHRPIPSSPKVYRPNKDRQPAGPLTSVAGRNFGAPVATVTVHRGWRGAWRCTFALRLERDDRPKR